MNVLINKDDNNWTTDLREVLTILKLKCSKQKAVSTEQGCKHFKWNLYSEFVNKPLIVCIFIEHQQVADHVVGALCCRNPENWAYFFGCAEHSNQNRMYAWKQMGLIGIGHSLEMKNATIWLCYIWFIVRFHFNR